jgi:hypothetical protein
MLENKGLTKFSKSKYHNVQHAIRCEHDRWYNYHLSHVYVLWLNQTVVEPLFYHQLLGGFNMKNSI